MYSAIFSKLTAIIYINSINLLVFVIEMLCVNGEVKTGLGSFAL